jgi:hypothetical protein
MNNNCDQWYSASEIASIRGRETEIDTVRSVSVDPSIPQEDSEEDWERFRELFGLPQPKPPGQRRFLGIETARRQRAEAAREKVEEERKCT